MRNLQLAYEILKIYEDFNKTEMTLLKLQKLAYYSYAIALAHDYDEELGYRAAETEKRRFGKYYLVVV